MSTLLVAPILLTLVTVVEGSLTFATPYRGFSSSAEVRSAAMPRMFANNHMPPIGMGVRPDRYRPPYHQNPYFIPSLPAPPMNQLGPHSSMASVLGLPPPPLPVAQQQPCPTSPFARFLSKDEQDVLHELIIEARRTGAPETEVKQYVEKYVKQILPPEKFKAFQEASNDFDRKLTLFRRGKRDVAGVPRRFDTVTFRNRMAKKPPQKVEIKDKMEFYDFVEVPKDLRSIDNLIQV